jgi:hypothetical protein
MLELAILQAICEADAGVEITLDALARAVAMTIAESGDIAAAQDHFAELLEAALMREGETRKLCRSTRFRSGI